MLRLPNARRPGLSLTEVLVTLFVVAIGLISLMTLFPVGAMQMGQALKDDRIRQTANQADGITRIWWQTEVVEQQATGNEDNFWKTLDNPNYPAAPSAAQPLRAPDGNPSYAVFLDPIGWQARIGFPVRQNWMAFTAGALPRRSARPLAASLPLTIRACSLLDDITFMTSSQGALQPGQPDTISVPNTVVREGAYNWCAVVQRPVNSNRYTADLKILVFQTKGLYGGHIPGLDQTGSEVLYSIANTLLNSANGGNTQVVLNVSSANFGLRSGSWILDGTNATTANFYRIQSITDNGPASCILELDTPLKSTASQIYTLKGLADVFDRPQLTASGYQRQAP